jgi:peroxiredoxin
MSRSLLAALLVAASTVHVQIQQVAPVDRLDELQKEYVAARLAFYRAMSVLSDTPESNKKAEALEADYEEGQTKRLLAAVELARANPKSDVAFAALEWVLDNPSENSEPARKLAIAQISAQFSGDSKAAKILALAEITKAHADAEARFRKAVDALPDTKDGEEKAQKMVDRYAKEQAERFAAAVVLAKSDPKSSMAYSALVWVLSTGRSDTPEAAPDLLREHHATNPKIGRVVARAGSTSMNTESPAFRTMTQLFEAVAQKNPDRTTRAQASAALALQATWVSRGADYEKAANAEEMAAKAELAFEELLKNYGDCPSLVSVEERSLGYVAKQNLFELRHLRIGKKAPDIVGEDLDGKKFKLSDYRGKVTVIVFWTTWCGCCTAMVPQEKKLVERLKGKPFVLIGVNGDEDREAAKQTAKKMGMTWRSFQNRQSGEFATIDNAWNIEGWPAIFVLDQNGVVRFRHVRGEKLEQAVDELLKAVDSPASNPTTK